MTIETLKEIIENEGIETEVTEVKKNNKTVTGVMAKIGTVSPVFYPNDDWTEEDLKMEIERTKEMENTFKNMDNVVTTKYAVNYEKNKELLKDVPHVRVCDLAIVTRGIFEAPVNGGCASFIVKDMDMVANCKPLETSTFSMGYFLVSTNKKMMYSSGVIGDNEFLKDIYKELGGKFFVLPSSIHEVLFVSCDPDGEPEAEVQAFRDMVREVNKTEISTEEWLSDNVYLFDGESLKIA